VPSAVHAHSAAAALARFHDLLLGDPATQRLPASSFHDTSRYMTVLWRVRREADSDVRATADAILDDWQALQRSLPPPAPLRPGHGDMKISNVLFNGARATALIDLDTVARYRLDDDLGDALRSWCNRRDENSDTPEFDAELFAAGTDGYLVASRTVALAERRAIVPGTIRIALELAARFCADAVLQSYFAWDAAIAPDARAHNLLRARGQLALARILTARRAELEGAIGLA
jgi:aminoglycoside phosphotransferase (APT) family kinase protein